MLKIDEKIAEEALIYLKSSEKRELRDLAKEIELQSKIKFNKEMKRKAYKYMLDGVTSGKEIYEIFKKEVEKDEQCYHRWKSGK